MVKFCMFSTLRLWSLVGSVMACWARTGSAAAAISRIKTPTLSPNAGDKGEAPRFLRAEGKRPTQAKAACVGTPADPALPPKDGGRTGHPTGTSCRVVGVPPLPPRILVFNELRRNCTQDLERMGVIRKIH